MRISDWSSDVCSSDLPRLPVIPVRALKNNGTEAFTAKQREVANLLDAGDVDMLEAQLQIEHYWAGALRRAVIDGDVEGGSLMAGQSRSEEHTSELQSLMRISYAVFCLKQKR